MNRTQALTWGALVLVGALVASVVWLGITGLSRATGTGTAVADRPSSNSTGSNATGNATGHDGCSNMTGAPPMPGPPTLQGPPPPPPPPRANVTATSRA
jgi:hypothetical protein